MPASKFARVLSDPSRKPLPQIARECFDLWRRTREPPNHYFTRFLYRREAGDYRDFVTNQEAQRAIARLNDPGSIHVLNDKLYFQLYFERLGVSVPKLLAVVSQGRVLVVSTDGGGAEGGDALEVLRDLSRRSLARAVFAKETLGMGGRQVLRLTDTDLAAGGGVPECIRAGVWIIQEAIEQHPEMSRVHPLSVNTLRFDTFRHDDGRVEVCSALARFGTDGRHVDNGSSGGCFVAVDTRRGRLRATAHRLIEYGGDTFTAHPTTGVVFEGYQVPYYLEATALVERAASLLPAVRLIGWDVAVCPDGPVIVEGNHSYHFGMQDIAYGGYRRHPTYRYIVDTFGRREPPQPGGLARSGRT